MDFSCWHGTCFILKPNTKKRIMTSLTAYCNKVFLMICLSVICGGINAASAQNATLNSRIAVVANETKTNIWVSDFPKQTSIVISDNDDNLLSIVSTNEFGAAYLTIPASIKTTVIVKTLNGEIKVSNKAVFKNNPEQTAGSKPLKNLTKA